MTSWFNSIKTCRKILILISRQINVQFKQFARPKNDKFSIIQSDIIHLDYTYYPDNISLYKHSIFNVIRYHKPSHTRKNGGYRPCRVIRVAAIPSIVDNYRLWTDRTKWVIRKYPCLKVSDRTRRILFVLAA